MKNVLFAFLIFTFTVPGFSQQEKYQKTLLQAIEKLDTAEHKAALLEVANLFERLANAKSEEWLPAYYHGYAQMRLAMACMEEQKMAECQAHVSMALASIEKALAIDGANSEVLALKGLAYQGRIWEDPQVKGAEFSMKSHQALDKAIALDPRNPRAHYLKAQNIFFTPSFYGGGAEAALPLLEKAESLFAAAEPGSPFAPQWGRESNQWLLKQARAAKNREKN